MAIKIIRKLISEDNLAIIEENLKELVWTDGKLTASGGAKDVKENQQCLDMTNPSMKTIIGIVSSALVNNAFVQQVIIPVNFLAPMLNSYSEGEFYGEHTDNSIRFVASSKEFVRCDLSMTVFLNEGYEGGELVIKDGDVNTAIKLNKGDCVVYPAGYLHEVKEVTKGRRICAVAWMQSGIRDLEQRDVIADLITLRGRLDNNDTEALKLLAKIRNNLVRQWAEV